MTIYQFSVLNRGGIDALYIVSLYRELSSSGDFDTGGLGYIGGPNVVTVRGADFCVEGKFPQKTYH